MPLKLLVVVRITHEMFERHICLSDLWRSDWDIDVGNGKDWSRTDPRTFHLFCLSIHSFTYLFIYLPIYLLLYSLTYSVVLELKLNALHILIKCSNTEQHAQPLRFFLSVLFGLIWFGLTWFGCGTTCPASGHGQGSPAPLSHTPSPPP
jgi:hypothetical protein